MNEKVTNIITNGLLNGYAGKIEPLDIDRDGFSGKGNDHKDSNGGHYHDEWFADHNGGGQELIAIGEEKFTRLYAGGVISQEDLIALGITKKDVILRLIESIQYLKNKTRLYDCAEYNSTSDWRYEYLILHPADVVPLTIGYESIYYRGKKVFSHGIMLSPIK